MKEIFTDLYKKVLGFFQTQEKTGEESKSIAVNRMKLVLMQDRTNLTPFLLERMRGEMIDVLAKYVEMDKDALELNFEQEGDQMALMLSIPVIRAKDEDEIKAVLEEEEKAKGEKEKEEAKCKEQSAKCHCEEDAPDEAIQTENLSTEEEIEETDEDIEENDEEEVCSCVCEDEDEETGNGEEETEEETSEEKSKRKK